MPLAIYFLPTRDGLILFGTLTLGTLLLEYARRRSKKVSILFDRFLASALRADERGGSKKMTGATYMLIGIFICLLFPKKIAVTAVAVLIVADTAAAIVGMSMGRTKFWGKSLEGSVAFLLSGLMVLVFLGSVMPHTPDYFASGTAAVVVATAIELYARKLRLDDNLAIPVTIALTMWLLQL